MMRSEKLLILAVLVGGMVLGARHLDAQIITYSVPTVTYYAPADVTPVIPAAPVTTYYAPATSVPVTTYYAPAVTNAPVTAYYAPAATTTVLSPVTTVVRTPHWVYDPSRILPRRRWTLVY